MKIIIQGKEAFSAIFAGLQAQGVYTPSPDYSYNVTVDFEPVEGKEKRELTLTLNRTKVEKEPAPYKPGDFIE